MMFIMETTLVFLLSRSIVQGIWYTCMCIGLCFCKHYCCCLCMHVILFDSNMQVIQANVTRQSSPIINEAPTPVKQPRKAIQVSSKVGKKVLI